MVKSYIFGRNHHSMNIRFLFLALLITIPFASVNAQYTEVINTNRPGGSDGAFSVGKNVYQIETGVSFGKEEHELLRTETSGLGFDYVLRLGLFLEQLELNISGEFKRDNITYTAYNPEIEQTIANFKHNTVGFKYLVYDPHIKRDLKGPNLYSWRANNKFQWSDLIPAIAVYAGANLDLDDENPFLPPNNPTISPKFMVATQNNWGSWVFVTNLIGDRVTSDYPTYSYILTLTHALNRRYSIFVENQGIKSDFYADQLVRGGAAGLINKNFQVDLSVTYSFKDTPSILYGRVGAAYRFDFHKDSKFLEDMDPLNKDQRKLEKKMKKQKKKKRP